MAQKRKQTEEELEREGIEGEGSFGGMTDFNLEEEYKPDPLIPGGNYTAHCTKAEFSAKDKTIVFEWTLVDNGGVCSDGETPVDGRKLWSRVWLPRPGDDVEMTKDGRSSKRQAKINMMTDFSQRLGINMSTLQALTEALENQEWVGLAVVLNINTREWEGKISNEVKKATKATKA